MGLQSHWQTLERKVGDVTTTSKKSVGDIGVVQLLSFQMNALVCVYVFFHLLARVRKAQDFSSDRLRKNKPDFGDWWAGVVYQGTCMDSLAAESQTKALVTGGILKKRGKKYLAHGGVVCFQLSIVCRSGSLFQNNTSPSVSIATGNHHLGLKSSEA